mgnify:CR=1 FL=1
MQRKKQLTTKEPYRKLRDNNWVVTVQENGKDKELYVELPPEMLNQVGWDDGDTLLWEEITPGAWQITKKEEDET